MNGKRGWHGQPGRHTLASKGIKTSYQEARKSAEKDGYMFRSDEPKNFKQLRREMKRGIANE